MSTITPNRIARLWRRAVGRHGYTAPAHPFALAVLRMSAATLPDTMVVQVLDCMQREG